MINKQGFGREYISKLNEFYQGEFDIGYRNGKGRLITNDLEVYDAEFLRGDIVQPAKTSKYILRNKYSQIVQSFIKSSKNCRKPHLMILS